MQLVEHEFRGRKAGCLRVVRHPQMNQSNCLIWPLHLVHHTNRKNNFMKSGFKPKTFSRKEWEDNRSPAAKGSGVGKALDAWKVKCPFDMKKITIKEIEEASTAAAALDKALDVAKKKCDPKAQKETIAGIGEYKKVVADYEKTLKATLEAKKKREDLTKSLSLKNVMADKELLVAFMDFTKKIQNHETMHTLLLATGGKHEEAVKLYGKNNDYNLVAPHYKTLAQAFLGKDASVVDPVDLEKAKKHMLSETTKMMGDKNHYNDQAFGGYSKFLELLDKRFPTADFSI